MAAFARGVTRARGDQRKLLLVTVLAQRTLRQLDHEVMRRMTALARHLAVKAVIGRRQLVAAAARSSERVSVIAPGVGVVTGEATARLGELGVIGVHGLMAVGARCSRVVPDIMGRVATRAARVLRHFGRGEHHDILVA